MQTAMEMKEKARTMRMMTKVVMAKVMPTRTRMKMTTETGMRMMRRTDTLRTKMWKWQMEIKVGNITHVLDPTDHQYR